MARRSYKELRDKMSPERQEESRQKAAELLAAMPLQEIRKALSLTQVQLAQSLNITQPSVAKLESQTDMYISTLKRFIEAMGGELKVTATFPGKGEVEITQFSSEDDEQEAA